MSDVKLPPEIEQAIVAASLKAFQWIEDNERISCDSIAVAEVTAIFGEALAPTITRLVEAAGEAERERIAVVVRELGAKSWWDAPGWTLHVPEEYANALFNVVYEDETPTLANLLANAKAEAYEQLIQELDAAGVASCVSGARQITVRQIIRERIAEERKRGEP